MPKPDVAGAIVSDLLADGPVFAPGIWDALSAQTVAHAGHRVGFVSGFAVAGSLLGQPDIGLLSQVEMAETIARITAAAPDLVVLADADTGYGDAANAARTTELWERAGAHGLFLEDQVWPKRCGHMAGKQVVSTEDWLAKLRAVLATRTSIHVTARTDARAAIDLASAIDRAKAAVDVGVDAIFVEAPESIAEMTRVAEELSGVTLVANMVEHGRTPLLSHTELHELGFDLVISPLTGLLAATKAMGEAYGTLADTGTMRDDLDRLTAFDEFTDLVGLPEHLAARTRFEDS